MNALKDIVGIVLLERGAHEFESARHKSEEVPQARGFGQLG